ncbi:MAG: hypothetical protein FWH11_03380 [Micrococcales bacterium]|nr:hypothetical protein [Micrococcales bacterium]
MTSVIFDRAAGLWRACRDEWYLLVESQIDAAERECRGRLVSRAGQADGLTAWDLFTGPRHRADRYATDELREWWATRHGRRLTFAEFERAWLIPDEGGAAA